MGGRSRSVLYVRACCEANGCSEARAYRAHQFLRSTEVYRELYLRNREGRNRQNVCRHAHELRESGVSVVSLYPGLVRTESVPATDTVEPRLSLNGRTRPSNPP